PEVVVEEGERGGRAVELDLEGVEDLLAEVPLEIAHRGVERFSVRPGGAGGRIRRGRRGCGRIGHRRRSFTPSAGRRYGRRVSNRGDWSWSDEAVYACP